MDDELPDVKVEYDIVDPPSTETPTPKTPKKRVAKTNDKSTPAPKKAKGIGAAATSTDQLSDVDKEMIRLKEEGMGWSDISMALEKMTGNQIAANTLSKRYGRLKASLARVDPAHIDQLKETYIEVTNDIQEEIKALRARFWTKVSEKLEGKCQEKYQATTLEKEWKRLASADAVSTIVVDAAGE